MGRRDGARKGSGRRRPLLLLLLLTTAILVVSSAAARPPVRSPAAYSYAAAQAPDVIVAGGLDGRVYAMDAWSGETLWSFDSGGPMVDSSRCAFAKDVGPELPPEYRSASARHRSAKLHRDRSATVDTDGSAHVASVDDEAVADRSVIQQQTAQTQAVAASAAFMAQLVPSYDGRLYHFSKNKVKELEMTMADIVNVNGPVRLAVETREGASNSDVEDTDILLFGEKRLEMFTLDAVSGLRRPYSATGTGPPSAAALWSKEILFGRSEFTTRAVHARNASSARCFKISEFFLDFAKQAHCSAMDDSHGAGAYMSPEILVLPKDPETAGDDEGSTIVAFDPWTSEQLWEFEVPDFDVLAVYGISTRRGATFYQWKVDGPSSTGEIREKARGMVSSHTSTRVGSHLNQRIEASTQHESEEPLADGGLHLSKQLTRVVPRTWDAMESRFRLRLLGDNYFLESNEDERGVAPLNSNSGVTPRPSFHGRRVGDNADVDDLHEEMAGRRRRRIFWEPIENDGKRGVFITYTHVGAMLVGVTTCGVLLAWGCYVKGLSASLAQSAIKSMDQSQFFMSHVHRLTIERPGEEDITISSSISRSLLMDTVGSIDRQLPLLDNGEPIDVLSTELSANVDPAMEAMLMEKFSRLVANEAAAIIASGGRATSKRKLLECDPDADSNATTATMSSSSSSITDLMVKGISSSSSTMRLSSGSSLAGRRLALPYAEEDYLTGDDEESAVYEVEMLPVVEEAEFLSSDAEWESDGQRFELADSDDEMFLEDEDSVITTTDPKVVIFPGESDTTGSCCSNDSGHGATKPSRGKAHHSVEEAEGTSSSAGEKSSEEKSSAPGSSEASSSGSGESSPNESEVLFPFVCQSRFVNEFEELSAIGKGGFGQVMLAENRLDGRKYAIKRVGLNLKNQTSKTLQKFLREVKILALLDHPNIVRYYQAWLEKVEGGAKEEVAAASSIASDTLSFGGLAEAKNYSTSNLLAPISELEFSGNQRQLATFYSNGSVMMDDEDDGGFDWERGSSSGLGDDAGWKEEDLVVQNKPRTRNAAPPSTASARSPREEGSDEDSSFNAAEKCDHWLYIQMQYCAGRNLADYLSVPTRPLELSRMLKIFVQIASALAHVHSCGLIHRDLKPANIFVADVERDEIKLGDFGLSRYAANVNLNASTSVEDSQPSSEIRDAPRSTSQWSVSMSNMSESNDVTAGVGTYLYASPEQVAGKKYNAKTDVYSLGMILFELCHDRFGTTMERYITLRDARESKFPPDLRCTKRCPELLDMLYKLLSHDPSTRPTADEVVHWGQLLYETSLAQKAMDVVRSPRNLDLARAASGGFPMVPGIDHLMAGSAAAAVLAAVVTTTFTLKVEAATEHSSGDEGGERRLPNHNLLKQVCDVIAGVSDGKVEIKKCGLHLQDEGVQILEFELDPQAALADAPGSDVEGSVVVAIEALPGVQIVHRVRLGGE